MPPENNPPGELDERPPFLTWPKIYAVVLAVLGVQVALYAYLTGVLR